MKQLQKLKLLTLILVGLLIYSCQNEEGYSLEKQETAIDIANLVYFKGIPVNHRFKTSIVNLEKDASDKFNFILKEKRIKNGINYARKGVETLDVEKFSEAVDESFKYFPYQEEGFDLEMVKRDFPTLSEEQIAVNSEEIDSYYSRNLNDMVASRYVDYDDNDDDWHGGGSNYNPTPPKMPAITDLKQAGEDTAACTLRELSIDWWDVKRYVAYYKAGAYATWNAALSYYSIGQTNTKRDSFRHTLWNGLLANHYYTMSAKKPRLDFAKDVADMNEKCGGNEQDSAAMDYHNNAIGRKIWDDDTTYQSFWGITYNIRNPSNSRLISLVKEKMNNILYIYKNESFDKEKQEALYLAEIERVYWLIKKADKNKLVYFSVNNDDYGY
jgi:hypothetical protein